MGCYSEELRFEFWNNENNIQGQKLDSPCEINKHVSFSHMDSTDLFSLYIMMCINFPITVRVLQNNERGFPLIFTITVIEFVLVYVTLFAWSTFPEQKITSILLWKKDKTHNFLNN
jgi:hypothetical protein